jgi:hypothetical protein
LKASTSSLMTALILVGLTGCAVSPPKKEMSSLEIQAVQAKNFEADKKTSFNSVVSVLQDLGYIIGSASLETGFITAESAVKNDTGFFDALGGVRREQRVAVTASIEEMKPNLTRVRFNFVSRVKRSGMNGQQANDDLPLQNAQLYQHAFDKVGEAVFIRKAQ